MTTETQSAGQPSSGSRLGRTARTTAGCLLRLLFIVILGIGLGAAVYYGVVYGAPALYYQYVYPVQQNTLRLEDLEARQAQSDQQLPTAWLPCRPAWRPSRSRATSTGRPFPACKPDSTPSRPR